MHKHLVHYACKHVICSLYHKPVQTCLHTQLSYEVKQHKARSQKVAAAPGSLDVIPLLVPLEPHADAIFQKGADETQTCQVG